MINFFQRYIDSWRFNGWFVHDIFLGIIIAVGLLLLLYVLFKRPRKGVIIIIFIIYAFLGNLLMIAFGLAGRSFPINSVSPIYTDDVQKVAVQMVEGSENNGTTNGITQIISHHQIVAINLQTGEKQWAKSSSSKETLIGYFMGGLLVHHRDGENGKFSLLDIHTGNEKLSEKEFTKKHKQLIDVLENGSHNIVLLQNNLYLEGVDGKFYRFDGKKLSEDNKAEKYISTKFFVESDIPGYFASHNQPLEDYDAVREFSNNVLAEPAIQTYKNLEPAIVDVDLQQQTAIVSYRQTKRESADSIVLSYDMKNHRMMWEENIGVVNTEQKNPGVRTLENYYAIQAGDEFLLLDKDTKKEMFRYLLRWNRPAR
ncbi:PA2928 family protein [Lysinibacillus sp. BPa_S21]|uniref:PA2928 family protein n=1 Tax=Lysinibacillus sp. BPa_S21 TaxID=2932478 RepID=UPI00201274DF|nr:PA2928 family protein [Lysinibacillus sp. BPa_S21]MCL1696809.1 hypothetical protein [Lysinibacillus sp. BPa_S21]